MSAEPGRNIDKNGDDAASGEGGGVRDSCEAAVKSHSLFSLMMVDSTLTTRAKDSFARRDLFAAEIRDCWPQACPVSSTRMIY